MSRTHGVIAGLSVFIIICLLPLFPLSAQFQQRENVIGVGDQLDILVFNQVETVSDFSTKVEVRSDRMITIPLLGDIKVAGLKKSTLTTLLESQKYLGRFLNEPHVTITPTRMAANIVVIIRGFGDIEQELPRDTKFGQLLGQIKKSFQQADPDFEAITIKSAEGEVFAADPNLRLQWGDEIILPTATSTSATTSEATLLPSGALPPLAQFTDEEYQAFQAFMEDYLDAYEQLLPLVRHEDDVTFIDLAELTDEQQAELPQAVIDELRRHFPQAEQPLETGFALLGIRVNLMTEGVQDTFLAFPQPEGGILIRSFQEGDIVRTAENGTDDLILVEVNETDQYVILEQGNEQQMVPVTPPLSDIALVGILSNRQGFSEAILQGASEPEDGQVVIPIQRKRYVEGDPVAEGVRLVKIVEEQQLAVLQDDNQAIQVLLLRDPRRREALQPPVEESSDSPVLDMEQPGIPVLEGGPNGVLPGVLNEQLSGMVEEYMPDQVQALDTLSQLLFATPLF